MNIRRILALLLPLIVLAACVVPDAPQAPVSPLLLPPQAFSPLPDPGRVGAPQEPVAIVSWNYLPNVSASTFESCAHNRTAAALLYLLANAPWQARKRVRCHPLLSNAAQAKTDAMAAGEWAAHTSPEGVSPNDNVRAAGYPLPDWYEVGGNHVESYAAGWGYSTPVIVMVAWTASPLHWNHLSAIGDPFFINQECMAVGYTQTYDSGFRNYWIVLSAPCSEEGVNP